MILLTIFMAAMLGAVLADDIILLFVFWEITSLASYLLVGTDSANPNARKAALKALLVTGGGGLALLAGLIMVSLAADTTSISGIIAARETVLADPAALPAMLLIIVGCFTKSAQLPFHFWLPAAMAASTPVSAYLHSATMVNPGRFNLLARFNPVYADEMVWQNVSTWVGVGTAAAETPDRGHTCACSGVSGASQYPCPRPAKGNIARLAVGPAKLRLARQCPGTA